MLELDQTSCNLLGFAAFCMLVIQLLSEAIFVENVEDY